MNIKYFSPLSQFDVVSIIPVFYGSFDISLTNLSMSVLFIVIFGYLFFFSLYSNRLMSKVWQQFMESIFLFIYRIIYVQMGKNGLIYFPFIFSLFTFILLLNLFSMLPYSFAVTSHFIWTLYFSLSICLGMFFIGLLKHKMHFFKMFVPEVPFLLYPMMMFIEILSYIMSSFSLAMSLSANMIAGHTLVHMLANFVFFLCNTSLLMVIMPFVLLLLVFMLELGVACLQAYIFIVLICMYLNDSINLTEH